MKKPQGFACLTPEQRQAMARHGGSSVPAQKRSFSQDRDLARRAGKLGGESVDPARRTFSRDRALAQRAGRLGGKAIPPEKRAFSRDPELASRAGKKGGGMGRVAERDPCAE